MSHKLLTQNPNCGLSPKRISDIEINRSATKLHELSEYAAFFDCTMESLFEEPPEPQTVPLTIDGRMDSVETRCYDVENRCYEIENRCAQLQSAQTTLKARVDFIVEILNTLQDIHNAPKELFQ